MTTDKDLEMYLEWVNEFYGKDFLNTMNKEHDMTPNEVGTFDIKPSPGFKDAKFKSKKE